MITLFGELRKHGKLAAKRHPMYEKNRFGKFWMYFMAVFWAGYMIFFGITLAKALTDSVHNMEAYHVINSGLLFILVIDFLMRFPIQKTPTQEVKPYLLLPVRRNRLIDFLLVRSGLSSFNLFWLFFFVPFAALSVTRFYGVTGVITYCIGIWLLMVFNNYWYLLCRTLINERIWWTALPVAVYGGLAGLFFFSLPKKDLLIGFFMNLGEGYIEGSILCFLATLAAIALMWWVNRGVMSRLIYNELNKVEDTKVKHVSEYKFLERYGEVGEYFRLELKMLFRNKRCKSSLRSVTIIVIAFSALLSFSSVYDGGGMKNFTTIYSFVVFGMIMLMQIMGFEGNYIDGLMTRKESIYSLLKAKYYLYSIAVAIPFVLMIPAIITGKLPLLSAFAFSLFAIGPVYFLMFQMAVYNMKTVPLNEGLSGRQNSGTAYQSLVSIVTFGLPLGLYTLLNALCGATVSAWIMIITGVVFVATSHIWIKNVYKRFMKRRYKNMEGFRDTRE